MSDDKLNILVASCVFFPEPVVSAKTSADVAQHLHELGHGVTVACPRPSRNVSKEKLSAALSSLNFPFEVRRLFAIPSANSSFISRFIENISFGLSLFLFILTRRKLDVVYANVWPIFSLGLACIACKIRGIRLVSSVQDLYPESLVAQGRISCRSILYRMLYRLDALIANNCDHVIVISEGFKKSYLSRGVSLSKLTVQRNWLNGNVVSVLEKNHARALLQNHQIALRSEDVLCVYGGNIGVASGLDDFFEAIRYVDKRVKFLLAGDGSLLPILRQKADSFDGDSRVVFVSPWDANLTSEVLCAADILLLPTAKGQEFASVPSKLITYMLAARPIFLMADSRSESAIELDKSGAGVISSIRDPESIALNLNKLVGLSEAHRESMGLLGRKYAEKFYSDAAALTVIKKILVADNES
ncbi:glycosyltransferase family 4 protein [Pseudomonas guariconensis]|uniref:glycosyltransferase family 4 protein n=1 Tax=Pseudomonas guariconensis TaxID=1288410 RepID=UPI003EDF6776